MPSDSREARRGPVRIRFILPDLGRLPWMRGMEQRLVGSRRIVLPKLDPGKRPPSAIIRRQRRSDRRADRQELVAAAIFGTIGLAITFGLMVWSGAIDFGPP